MQANLSRPSRISGEWIGAVFATKRKPSTVSRHAERLVIARRRGVVFIINRPAITAL